MDLGTPSRPPDYYLGYTERNDSNGARDSLTDMSATHSHTASTNPAAVRLLTSMDHSGIDDDSLSAPTLHTSGVSRQLHRGSVSAVPPQLPEIRPLGSSTSYVSSTAFPCSSTPFLAKAIAPVSTHNSLTSKVAAVVCTLNKREQQETHHRSRTEQGLGNRLSTIGGVSPTTKSAFPSMVRPLAGFQNTVQFSPSTISSLANGGCAEMSPINSLQFAQKAAAATVKFPAVKLQQDATRGVFLEPTKVNSSFEFRTPDSKVAVPPLLQSLSRKTSPVPDKLSRESIESGRHEQPTSRLRRENCNTLNTTHTDKSRLRFAASQDPFQVSAASAHPSIDPPLMIPPPPDSPYSPLRGLRGEVPRAASPNRPWTPSRRHYAGNLTQHGHSSSFSAANSPECNRFPPSPVQYEPADINGSPRPGTPSSQYGGSPRRPLPPAPLFAKTGGNPRMSTFADDATISISLDEEDRSEVTGISSAYTRHSQSHQPQGNNGSYRYEAASSVDNEEEDDDVFRPRSEVSSGSRSRQMMYENNFSQVTLNDPDAGGDGDEAGRDIGVMYAKKDGLEEDGDAESDLVSSTESKIEHYGPAPKGRQERRGVREPHMSKKAVQLIDGKLVLECKIPTILFSFLPRRDEIEFTHMRYTAVTCDPDDFVERGYKLRQSIGRTARETELFICVTMYNENAYDFTRTMHAVMKNIAHFCGRNKSRTWGELGWQKIVVCVVSDGREKIHARTLDALAAMGVYQHGIAKNFVNQKAVQAHVYEYTTQVSLDSDLKFKGAEKGIVPCQMIFCLKERNQRKLNSHRWFFNAFGRSLNPNVCILLDVGTRPGSNSLYHLWKAFDTDSNVAGACGEIKAMKGRFGGNLLNPLVASQNFEYKMSNILDKPLESVFGYITVLPGALSAYRYHALQNDETGHGPLSQYFKGETLHGQHADVFTANMYLAEDRILCWELVAKRGERWVLKYVKGCTGETDVPDTVPEFISQRRRWLNGAFFAAVYSLVHFKQLWTTDHTISRKILLHIEFIYQLLQLLFTYFSLANFYLTFYFVAGGLADPTVDPFGHSIGKYIFTVLRYICTLLIATQFILSLGNRPQGAKKLYLTSMILYSVLMIYTTFATFYIVIRQLRDSSSVLKIGDNVFTNLIVSTVSTVGLYFAMSFLYLDPWHMFTSSAQYFMLLPSYICTLQVYAFCNTHDVTWGTKGDNVMKTDLGGAVGKGSTVELEMPSEQLDIDSGYDEALRNLRDRVEVPSAPPSEAQMQEDYYKSVRTYMVVSWMIANGILAMAVSDAYGSSGIGNNFYLRFILWSVAALALFRAAGSTTFAVINAVNVIIEGRMRLSLKVPEWLGGFGSKMSETMSSIGSSVRG